MVMKCFQPVLSLISITGALYLDLYVAFPGRGINMYCSTYLIDLGIRSTLPV